MPCRSHRSQLVPTTLANTAETAVATIKANSITWYAPSLHRSAVHLSRSAVARRPRAAMPHHHHGSLYHPRPLPVPRCRPHWPAQPVRGALHIPLYFGLMVAHMRSTESVVNRLIKYNADRGIILWYARYRLVFHSQVLHEPPQPGPARRARDCTSPVSAFTQ